MNSPPSPGSWVQQPPGYRVDMTPSCFFFLLLHGLFVGGGNIDLDERVHVHAVGNFYTVHLVSWKNPVPERLPKKKSSTVNKKTYGWKKKERKGDVHFVFFTLVFIQQKHNNMRDTSEKKREKAQQENTPVPAESHVTNAFDQFYTSSHY